MTEPQLEPELERVALALLRHLEWQDSGFSLVFLFVDFGVSTSLVQWLNDRLSAQGRPLQRYEMEQSIADRPDEAVDHLLEMIIPKDQPLWFGIQNSPLDAAWNIARCRFLSRLNERRFLLETKFARPLVLVLPVGFREQTRTLAPDIWHVRTMSEELSRSGQASKAPGAIEDLPSIGPAAPRGTNVPLPAYEDWLRIRGGGRLDRIDPHTAAKVVRELLAAGRPSDARAVAVETLEIVRKRAHPDAHREMAVAILSIGDVALALGDWVDARRAYDEAMRISRDLNHRLDVTPDSLRELSVALDKVGRVIEAQSELNMAEAVYKESLELRHRLQARLSEVAKPAISLRQFGRGRFDRTEPTIMHEQDLDVPTFIRRGISLE